MALQSAASAMSVHSSLALAVDSIVSQNQQHLLPPKQQHQASLPSSLPPLFTSTGDVNWHATSVALASRVTTTNTASVSLSDVLSIVSGKGISVWLAAWDAQLEHLSLIHISEPTRLLSISYAVFCLKKKKKNNN
eukprot:TRINITY_DN23924_c0_g2_i1.p1 TRINITY_DN23924_c0_g2~~TRINITY_DN23924_c0_g2_i1.p1  ORF type:complete len:135 (+),score=25.28 TRINITY_DN23924_c0_g2_i1:225-629(+)